MLHCSLFVCTHCVQRETYCCTATNQVSRGRLKHSDSGHPGGICNGNGSGHPRGVCNGNGKGSGHPRGVCNGHCSTNISHSHCCTEALSYNSECNSGGRRRPGTLSVSGTRANFASCDGDRHVYSDIVMRNILS